MDAEELELLEGVIDEGVTNLEEVRELICVSGVRSRSDVDKLFRYLHTIKGNASMLGMEAVTSLSHQIEEVLDHWRTEQLGPSLHLLNTLEVAVDGLSTLLVGARHEPNAELDSRTKQIIADLSQFGASGEVAPEAITTPNSAGENQGTAAPEQSSQQQTETIRISTKVLDSLMGITGELLYLAERLRFLNARAGDSTDVVRNELPEISLSLGSNIDELHETLMSARLESAGQVTRSLERIVRDAARDTGKNIQFETVGDSTRIDRLILRTLHDPLVHMLRNAVDHGIEKPEIRAEQGKPAAATISLKFSATEHWIRLELSDDGKGMNSASILDRAVEKKIITPEGALSMSEGAALNLIFSPGFSTAEAVSNLSGRGVGMDVVRQSVTELGGDIDIKTSMGEGSCFSIAIPQPASLVVDGIVVRVGKAIYLLPIDAVDGFQKSKSAHEVTLMGNDRIIATDTGNFPLVELTGELHASKAKETFLVYVSGADAKKCAFQVHEVLGRHRVLVRALKLSASEGANTRDAFLLGDGRIGFLLSVEALMDGRISPPPSHLVTSQ